MYYNHNLKHSSQTQHKAQGIRFNAPGYYAVFIQQKGHYVRHVIKAFSAEDAAFKIEQMTGVIPASQKDIVGPLASSSHGYDKKTRDIWLNA
tara:strand:+ start:269 stop:544 length:276 start_codon:yes stop_codon:yes gene_type:complete